MLLLTFVIFAHSVKTTYIFGFFIANDREITQKKKVQIRTSTIGKRLFFVKTKKYKLFKDYFVLYC